MVSVNLARLIVSVSVIQKWLLNELKLFNEMKLFLHCYSISIYLNFRAKNLCLNQSGKSLKKLFTFCPISPPVTVFLDSVSKMVL